LLLEFPYRFFAFLWFSAPTQPTDMQKCFKKINRNARKEIEKLLLLPVHQKDYDGTGLCVRCLFVCGIFFHNIFNFVYILHFYCGVVVDLLPCSVLLRFCSFFNQLGRDLRRGKNRSPRAEKWDPSPEKRAGPHTLHSELKNAGAELIELLKCWLK